MSSNSINLQNTLSNILLRLDGLDRKIDNMNRNLDFLLTQFNPNNALGGHNPLATGDISWNDPSFGGMNGRSTGGTLNPMGNPPRTPAIALSRMGALEQGGPSYFEVPNMLDLYSHPPQVDPPPLLGVSNDLSTLPQRITSASTVDVQYSWADQVLPQTSRVPIPLPPVTPGHETGGYGALCDDDFDAQYNNFAGGDYNDHQSTQHAAENLVQVPELSAGFAIAETYNEENDTQLESSSSTPMSSNTKYDKGKRTEMVSQKLRCLEQICEEMKINWTGDRLLALQKIIVGLGWAVPENGFAAQERRGRDKAISACYKELKRRVGPWDSERVVELNVLQKALARAQRGGEELPGGSGSGKIVFSL